MKQGNPLPHWFPWLGAAVVIAGLLGSAALFERSDDFRWGALVLLLCVGLTAVLALVQSRTAPTSESGQARETPPGPRLPKHPETGLPLHPATGLYMPWIFHQRLAEEIARAKRYQHELAILLLEPATVLDQQEPEDYALAAKALRSEFRSGDFAAQFDQARIVVLLPETDLDGAKVAGKRLLANVRSFSEERLRWRGALVIYPQDGEDPTTLLHHAQTALRRGRLTVAEG